MLIFSDLEVKLVAPVAPSVLPLSDKPVTLSLSKGPVKIGIGASTAKTLGNVGLSLDDEPEEEEEQGTEPNKRMSILRAKNDILFIADIPSNGRQTSGTSYREQKGYITLRKCLHQCLSFSNRLLATLISGTRFKKFCMQVQILQKNPHQL